MGEENAGVAPRDKLLNLLTSDVDPEQREAMLSCLTRDERQAFLYHCKTVPLLLRHDPNSRIPAPPFNESTMERLLKSAGDKLAGWSLDRILDGKRIWTEHEA